MAVQPADPGVRAAVNCASSTALVGSNGKMMVVLEAAPLPRLLDRIVLVIVPRSAGWSILAVAPVTRAGSTRGCLAAGRNAAEGDLAWHTQQAAGAEDIDQPPVVPL